MHHTPLYDLLFLACFLAGTGLAAILLLSLAMLLALITGIHRK